MEDKLRDNVPRVKRFNPLGMAIFVGLRAADVPLQYFLLQRGWATRLVRLLGGRSVDARQLRDISGTLPPYYNLISLMAFGSSVKQIVTMLLVTETDTPASAAVIVSLFNTAFNSFNTILSVWSVTSQSPAAGSETIGVLRSPVVLAGTALYLVGILMELVSELQRTRFKKNPANKGKPYGGGLFYLARHINYGGYTIWRTSYALTSAGWAWALVVGSFFFHDFASRGVPVLDAYLLFRYGGQWSEIKARVPYRLIPGVY